MFMSDTDSLAQSRRMLLLRRSSRLQVDSRLEVVQSCLCLVGAPFAKRTGLSLSTLRTARLGYIYIYLFSFGFQALSFMGFSLALQTLRFCSGEGLFCRGCFHGGCRLCEETEQGRNSETCFSFLAWRL